MLGLRVQCGCQPGYAGDGFQLPSHVIELPGVFAGLRGLYEMAASDSHFQEETQQDGFARDFWQVRPTGSWVRML